MLLLLLLLTSPFLIVLNFSLVWTDITNIFGVFFPPTKLYLQPGSHLRLTLM